MKKGRRERNSRIMVLFMAFIMVGSVFGIMFFGYDQESKVKYNGIVFLQKNNLWVAKINGEEVIFNYLPDDVTRVDISEDVSSRLKNPVEIDITSDFNSTLKETIALAEQQMVASLGSFGVFVRVGFTTENRFDVPVIRCEDATLSVPVVYFREGNKTRAYLQDNCIIAEGRSSFDVLRIKDRMLYDVLGILK
jgi:hypothetical protein